MLWEEPADFAFSNWNGLRKCRAWETTRVRQSLRDHMGQIGMEGFPPEGWWGICLRQEERKLCLWDCRRGPGAKTEPGYPWSSARVAHQREPGSWRGSSLSCLMGGSLRLVLRVFLMGITDLSNSCYSKKETKIDCFPCHYTTYQLYLGKEKRHYYLNLISPFL